MGPLGFAEGFHSGPVWPAFLCLFHEGLHSELGGPHLGNMSHGGLTFGLDGFNNKGAPFQNLSFPIAVAMKNTNIVLTCGTKDHLESLPQSCQKNPSIHPLHCKMWF